MNDFADACRETGIRFSLGYPIGEPVRNAILGLTRAGVEAVLPTRRVCLQRSRMWS